MVPSYFACSIQTKNRAYLKGLHLEIVLCAISTDRKKHLLLFSIHLNNLELSEKLGENVAKMSCHQDPLSARRLTFDLRMTQGIFGLKIIDHPFSP